MLKVDESPLRPELLAKLFSRDHLARLFQEHNQDLKGLVLQLDFHAVLAQFARSQVQLKRAETDNWSGLHARLQSVTSMFTVV